MSARIEITIEEYQGFKSKIKNLESALNSVSQEAALYKEKIEQAKALVEDLDSETFVDRLFKWKSLTKPLRELFAKNNYGEIQKTSKA